MRIALLSDLHINSKYNNFKMTDVQMYEYLVNIISNVDLLVLNGDVIDLWRTLLPFKKWQRKELEKVILTYSHTFRLIFNEPRIKIIIGNHDLLLLDYINDPRFKNTLHEQLELFDLNNNKILIYHGHFDIFNRYFTQIGQTVTYIEFNIEKIFRLFFLLFLFERFKKIYHFFGFRNNTQIKKMKEFIDLNDSVTCVANGHTHKSQILKFKYKDKKRMYINTGFSDGKTNNLVILDSDNLTVETKITNKTDLSKIKNILKKGDILLTSKTKEDIASNILRKAFKINYTNAIVYIGNNQVIDTLIDIKNGVQICSLDKYLNLEHNLMIVRMKDDSKIEKFISNLESVIGKKFSIIRTFINRLQLIFRKNITIKTNGTTSIDEILKATEHEGLYSINSLLDRKDIFEMIETFQI